MENKEFLRDLLRCPSPSGYEKEARKLIIEYLEYVLGDSSEETQVYAMGSFYVKQGSGPKKIMISAHYDEIGFQISYIDDSGFLHIQKIGGLDLKVLPGSVVQIKSRKTGKFIKGVIGKKPIHDETAEERECLKWKEEDVIIDLGVSSSEEARELISIGDVGVILREPNLDFGMNRLTGRALDDKIGVYILTQVAKNLSSEVLSGYSIYYTGFCQEETGLRGAIQSAGLIDPDISIDIDVFIATDEGRGVKKNFGELFLGKGPAINHGSDKNPDLNDILLETLSEVDIDYQEVVTRPGSTETCTIQEGCSNCKTTHLSIPLRNMHTPVEVCDWKDVEGAIKLLTEIIKRKKL